MTERKFPSRLGDDSFIVSARFTTSDHSICALVSDYVKAWVRANRSWIRIWRSDSIQEERLDFYADFVGEPRVEAQPEGSSFSVILEGRPSATRWKDWAVFLVDDISKVFPEAKFERFD